MKKWTKPMAGVETFATNDSVSACYGVKCIIGQGDPTYGTPYTNKYTSRTEYHWNGTFPAGVIGNSEMSSVIKAQENLGHSSDCGSLTYLRDDGSVVEDGKGSEGRVGAGVNLSQDINKYICWYTDDVNHPGTIYWHFGKELGKTDHPNRS